MQLDKENNLSQQQFNELERTYQEQLKLVEREKNKHLECNIIDREKFDNIYTDLKGKLENKNEALEIEIKAKIQDNRVLAEELYKYKERNADNESKLDFQNKSVSRLQEENQWNLKELEKVKMEFSKYRNSKDKYCNDLEITNEKLSKENESLRKESKSLTIKNDNLNKEQKKRSSKYVFRRPVKIFFLYLLTYHFPPYNLYTSDPALKNAPVPYTSVLSGHALPGVAPIGCT